MHRRILNLCDSSVSQSRDCSMAVTLLYLLYVLYTYRAALLCTLSIQALSLASQGDHTEAAYSTCGRTSDLYALSRTSLVDFRFRLRTFRVLVAFAATCLQWTSHLRLDWMVTPRYFVWGDIFQHCIMDRVIKRYGLG